MKQCPLRVEARSANPRCSADRFWSPEAGYGFIYSEDFLRAVPGIPTVSGFYLFAFLRSEVAR